MFGLGVRVSDLGDTCSGPCTLPTTERLGLRVLGLGLRAQGQGILKKLP